MHIQQSPGKGFWSLFATLGLCLLVCVTVAVHAQQAPVANRAIDQRVDTCLRGVIQRGAEVYNNGDPAGCYYLFEGALLALRPLLDNRPELQKDIDRAVAAARRNPSVSDRAFQLRDMIDKLCDNVSPPVAKKPPLKPKVVEDEAGAGLTAAERNLIDLTNNERAKEGLRPLKPSPKLVQAARRHSANMAKQDTLAHDLDEQTPADRLQEVGYRSASWGENIAGGSMSPSDAITIWMGSEGHRANILNPHFTEIGVGISVNNRGGRYYTQVFGIPR